MVHTSSHTKLNTFVTYKKTIPMNLIEKFKSLFVNDTPECYRYAEKVIRRMGFKKVSTCTYSSISQYGEKMITFRNGDMYIKVYGNGYAETEVLRGPLDNKKKIKNFVLSN
jgi:hypothetical protein